MSNFSFKGDILCRLVPSGGVDLLIRGDRLIHPPGKSYGGDTVSRDTVSPTVAPFSFSLECAMAL